MDKLKALRFEFVCQHVHASDIGAGSAEAVDKTYMHGILTSDEYDGYGCGCGFRGERGGRCADSSDNCHLLPNQLGRECRQLIELSMCPSIFDLNVLAVDITR